MQGGVWKSFTTYNLTLLIHQKGTWDWFMDQQSGPIETKGAKCLLRVSDRVRLKT